jgi:hypothetical protein
MTQHRCLRWNEHLQPIGKAGRRATDPATLIARTTGDYVGIGIMAAMPTSELCRVKVEPDTKRLMQKGRLLLARSQAGIIRRVLRTAQKGENFIIFLIAARVLFGGGVLPRFPPSRIDLHPGRFEWFPLTHDLTKGQSPLNRRRLSTTPASSALEEEWIKMEIWLSLAK